MITKTFWCQDTKSLRDHEISRGETVRGVHQLTRRSLTRHAQQVPEGETA
jgi:hypothetical protein